MPISGDRWAETGEYTEIEAYTDKRGKEKDERSRGFYLRHDFIPLPTQPNRLFYPMKTIEKLFPRGPEGTKESRR